MIAMSPSAETTAGMETARRLSHVVAGQIAEAFDNECRLEDCRALENKRKEIKLGHGVKGTVEHDVTDCCTRVLPHVHTKNNARILESEDWFNSSLQPLSGQYELRSDKSNQLYDCFFLDGSAESVWEIFVISNRLARQCDFGHTLDWFDRPFEEWVKTAGARYSWISEGQLEQIKTIGRNSPAVKVVDANSAEIVYCQPAQKDHVDVCGQTLENCVIRVVRRRVDLSKVEISNPEILLELSSDTKDVECFLLQLEDGPIQTPRCEKTVLFDGFKWAIYNVGKVLFLPAGLLMIPLTLVLTNIIGLICAIPIVGLLALFFLTVIWLCFYVPLYALSLIQVIAPVLAPVISLLGSPIAYIGRFVVGLFPSMGERRAKAIKTSLLEAWPYTFEMSNFQRHQEIGTKGFSNVIFDMVSTPGDDGELIRQLIREKSVVDIVKRHNDAVESRFEEVIF